MGPFSEEIIREGPLPEGGFWYPFDQLRKNPWSVSLHCVGIFAFCIGF